ncbi:hypothetical protein VB816_13120 [Limnoraphis robusta CCNP1324]|uniref:hypothetical protein n=1 Tax=Limnoraphis robusta TaxID=1118279 RepID=UPI002B21CFE4|nr:hypothetical protein [Limnoraphis robusta]MEA5545922.1 hypothetical protein [Limnoraphis robusta CCNP1324]
MTAKHRYAVDQHVRLFSSRFSHVRASETGVYRVTRLMPFDQHGEVSYRVAGTGCGERAVRESEIEMRVPAPDSGWSIPLIA